MDLLEMVCKLTREREISSLNKNFLQACAAVSEGLFCGVFLTDFDNKQISEFIYYSIENKLSSPDFTPVSLDKKDSPLAYTLITNKSTRLTFQNFIQCTEIKNFNNNFKQQVQLVPVECNQRYGILVLFVELDYVLSNEKEEEIKCLGDHYLCLLHNLISMQDIKKRTNHLERQLKKIQNKGANSYKRNRKLLETVLVGKSSQLEDMRNAIQRVANSNYNVLVRGETGSGKELVVQEIYRLSSVLSGELIIQNCAAIPHDLLESELFGYEKGAFTGAEKQKKGLFSLADKGMLFLDEIGDLSLELQSKILRVLQEKSFRPLGGTTEIKADFRLVAATHQPLEKMIEEGRFREDLYYRLKQSSIIVPPLREHKTDIALLSRHFIRQFEQKNNVFNLKITKGAIKELNEYDYQGNIRELKNIIIQACLFVIDEEDALINSTVIKNVFKTNNSYSSNFNTLKESSIKIEINEEIENLSLKNACEVFEAYVIGKVLNKHQGHRKNAAIQLQTPIRTFSYKCQKYGL